MAFGILVFTAHPMWYQVHYQTLVLLLLPFIIRNIFQLAYPTTGHGKVFDTALLIGICCLFYFPTVVLIIWLFQTLLVLRNFNLREWLMPLIGMGLPFLYLWSYRYVMEVEGEWFPIDSFISLGLPSFLSLSHTWLVFALLLTLLTLLTLPRYLRDIQLNKIRVRKSLSMLTWLLVYALIGVFIFKANVHYLTLVVGFPLSLILTIFFEKRETSRWMNYLSYGLIIALLVHLVTGFF